MVRFSQFVAAAAVLVAGAPVGAHARNQSPLEDVTAINREEASVTRNNLEAERKRDAELPRRIIVAPSADGRSHVAREDMIPQSEGTGVRLTNLWLAPATPVAKENPDLQGFIPFTMGQLHEPLYAITLVEYPAGTGQIDPGMHATPTIDHFYVIEGEIVLVLEDGEASLGEGDVAIVQGAVHGWRNDSARPARLLFFTLPAR